jgi:hypothetical protein
MTVHGIQHIDSVLGRSVIGVRRYVMGLRRSDDVFGHGVTEFDFEGVKLVVRPGPNEDYLVVEQGEIDRENLDPEYWTKVDLSDEREWMPAGRLKHVDVFSDGIEDVALVFSFDSGEQCSVVLCDTDVALGRGLERFSTDPNKIRPSLRTRIGA